MQKNLVAAGAIACFFGVAFGAFGAHALNGVIEEKAIGWFQTGVQYQLVHGLALLFCGVSGVQPGRGSTVAGVLFIAGILLFCGSLYAMALGMPARLGLITPIGGICFLAGWASVIWCTLRRQ